MLTKPILSMMKKVAVCTDKFKVFWVSIGLEPSVSITTPYGSILRSLYPTISVDVVKLKEHRFGVSAPRAAPPIMLYHINKVLPSAGISSIVVFLGVDSLVVPVVV